MKTVSKEELQEQAKTYFEKYGVKKLYGVSDGQIFLLESRAKAHAGSRNVYTLECEESTEVAKQSEPTETVLTIVQLKEELSKETNLETLRDMLVKEIAGLNRKGAVSAINERMEKLSEEPKTEEKEGSKTDSSEESQAGAASKSTNADKGDSQEAKGDSESLDSATV